MPDQTPKDASLWTHFASLKDKRMERCRKHSLQDILVIAICGFICGVDNWADMELFGETFLELPNGIPSHDTFGRVFSLLEPESFARCFTQWAQAVADVTEAKESLKNKFSVSRVVEIMSELESIRYKYNALQAGMSETVRRRWAASEALALGRGGMTLVARATGLSAPTIRRGIRELKTGTPLSEEHVRRPGGGRKKVTAKDETLLRDLEALVAPLYKR